MESSKDKIIHFYFCAIQTYIISCVYVKFRNHKWKKTVSEIGLFVYMVIYNSIHAFCRWYKFFFMTETVLMCVCGTFSSYLPWSLIRSWLSQEGLHQYALMGKYFWDNVPSSSLDKYPEVAVSLYMVYLLLVFWGPPILILQW